MVAQPTPLGGRHVVRRPRDQHVVSLAVQALGQRDHRVHVTSGAERSEQNFHARSLCCAVSAFHLKHGGARSSHAYVSMP